MRLTSIFQYISPAETALLNCLRMLVLAWLIVPGMGDNPAQAAAVTWTGSVDSNWNTTAANWFNGAPTIFSNNDSVTFDNTSAVQSIFVHGPLTVTNATVSGAAYTLTAGTNPTIVATGTVAIAPASSLTLNPGVSLQIGDGGLTGDLTGSLVNNGTLTFFRSDSGGTPYVIAGALSGNGILRFRGTGALNQSAYQGDAASTAFAGNVFVGTGARLQLVNSSLSTGSGITVESGGSLWLESGTTYSSPIFIEGEGWLESAGQLGALRLGGHANVIGTVTLTAAARISARNTQATISGVIGDNGNGYVLEKTESGTLTLSGANTYSGGTLVSAGTLQLQNGAGAGSGGIAVASGAFLDLNALSNYSMSNLIFGQGALLKTEAGTVDLSAALIAPGSLSVNEGVLNVVNTLETLSIGTAVGSTLNVGTLRLAGGNTLALNNLGTFGYNRLEIEGIGNSITGTLPSAAGKNLHFILPGSISGGATMLTVPAPGMDISGAALSLGAANYLNNLIVGDTIILIDHTTGTIINPNATYATAYGASRYGFTVASLTDSLRLIYAGLQNNVAESAKPYLEGGVSGMVALAEGGRFVGTQGISGMVSATSNGPGAAITAGVSGFSYSEQSGSHVDVSGVSALSGPVWRFDSSLGLTRLGLFVEAGWGNYDTFNSFATGAVNGDGDLEHYGGGILARHDWRNGLYAETSFRAGMVRSEFSTGDMGIGSSFDSDTSYLGAHVGLGWVWSITEQDALDVYAKGFWTRQNGDSVTTRAGEQLKLKDADSLNMRIGGRYTRQFTEAFSGYAGAAWDKEFDGKQRGTLDGVAVRAPSLKGDSAFGELGLTVKPVNSAWGIDVNLHGNLGQREGVGGNVFVSFEF